MPRVLLFRTELLPLSETFIAAQAGAMQRYQPAFAGLKRIPNGLLMNGAQLIIHSQADSLRDKVARRVYLRSGFAPGFFRRIEATSPDLLHVHFATDACAALPIQKRLRVPLAVTLHGYDVTSDAAALRSSRLGSLYLRKRNALWERARIFICVSESIRQKALERGFPQEKLWVHPIGVDVDQFRPDPHFLKEPLVLFVGRLVEKKGCIHLLGAMQIVKSRMPHARLVIIGDGPLRAELEKEARAILRLCEFLGAADADTVRQWMWRAAVVAVPSIPASNGDSEGLCLVACEAQAMGLPVVGFRGPGIEVVDGQSGFLVRPRDEAALAESLLAVLTDENLAARMGAAGRRRVERLFNLRRQTALLEEKYDELLNSADTRVR